MRRFKNPTWTAWILLAAAVPSLAGCSGRSVPPAADATISRDSLRAALDAWQRGDRPVAFEQKTGTVVIDPDWQNGLRLTRYQIGDNDVRFGADLRCQVVLSFQDGSGKTFDKSASYTIGTNPKITIACDEELGSPTVQPSDTSSGGVSSHGSTATPDF